MTCDQDLYIKSRKSWAKEKILKHINKQNKLIQMCCLIITDMLISAPILHEKSAVAFAEIFIFCRNRHNSSSVAAEEDTIVSSFLLSCIILTWNLYISKLFLHQSTSNCASPRHLRTWCFWELTLRYFSQNCFEGNRPLWGQSLKMMC